VQVGTPRQIYHEPRNRYVAEFVGNTNIVPARVERGADGIRLRIADGLSFQARRAVGKVPDGADTVPVMVRPEYVELTLGHDGAGVPARIGEIEFVGQVTAVSIDLRTITLRAIALSRPDIHLAPDSPCRVRIADENVVILTESTSAARL
jgi:ABC-type Fe3+/spermidine/putrescine transport system ATPase subunit